jgi:hypothetical protein
MDADLSLFFWLPGFWLLVHPLRLGEKQVWLPLATRGTKTPNVLFPSLPAGEALVQNGGSVIVGVCGALKHGPEPVLSASV